jgi:basic membrane protein A and related proteins
MYDSGVDYSTCSCANVYSLEFAQNEGSYLAGVYTAAMIADGSVEGLEGDAIGAIGGLDIPVINDFIAGYTQGAQSVNPDIQVLVDYVSGASPFFDPARGKELALAQYEQGAAFIFGIAGGTGQGIIEAAEETGRYTIGVDSDQYLLLAESDPEAAATILTSMMKNVDNTLFRAIDLHIKGELGYGGLEIVGLAEGAVGLAKNDYYNEITPDSVKAIVGEAERGILACEIDVDSALEREDPCTPVEMSEGTMEATPEATASN